MSISNLSESVTGELRPRLDHKGRPTGPIGIPGLGIGTQISFSRFKTEMIAGLTIVPEMTLVDSPERFPGFLWPIETGVTSAPMPARK